MKVVVCVFICILCLLQLSFTTLGKKQLLNQQKATKTKFISEDKVSSRSYSEGKKFCYTRESECGPGSRLWDHQCRGGYRQSPINIYEQGGYNPRLDVYLSKESLRSKNFEIRNNGHTIEVNLQKRIERKFTRPFSPPETYQLEYILFHWGTGKDPTDRGSEHMIRDKSYAMEIQFVFHNTKFKSVEDAIKSGNNLAVSIFSVFADASSKKTANKLMPIVRAVSKVKNPSPKPTLVDQALDLIKLFEPDTNFFYYNGSMTTPGCHELVEWYIADIPIPINKKEMDFFREIKDFRGEAMILNNRPIQNLNYRHVEYLGLKFDD